jgi:hypothetical protein
MHKHTHIRTLSDEDEVNMKVYAKQLGIVLQAFGMQVTTKFICVRIREEFARISLGVK